MLPSDTSIYSDLDGGTTLPVCDLFRGFRPDIAIVTGNRIVTWELTICNECNLLTSRAYKQNKYVHLASAMTSAACRGDIETHTIEVSTLGFLSNVLDFTKSVNVPKLPRSLIQSIIHSVIHDSFIIYCNRNTTIFSS